MTDTQGNRRIAKNTLLTYGNMLVHMLIGLYTSRLVLHTLGVSDYGLFNVVGGIIGLFTFIFGSLSATTTRFINVEAGKPDGDLNKVFNICNTIHIGIAIAIFIIAEAGGIFYIHHYLNVEPGKEGDAMFIFQLALLSTCLGVMNSPYGSLFNAAENFLFGIVVGLGTKIVQLGLIIFLLHYDGNKVRAYTLMMILPTIASYVVYFAFSKKYWPDIVKWRFVKKDKLYKEALAFNNYNLLSTAALMGRSQGSSMLINFFFGTTVNGAFAVAKSVETYVMSFAGKFDAAAGPQITQNYSAGNMDRVMYLTCRMGKYCLLLMMIAFFPLYAEIPFLLDLWLIEVPEGAVEFCRMTLWVAFVSASGGGIVQVINASGKIAAFKTTFSILMLTCLPIGYWMFKTGAPAFWLIGFFALVDAFWRILQLFFMKRIIGFPIMQYIKEAYLPAFKVGGIMAAILAVTAIIPLSSTAWHACRFALLLVAVLLACGHIGLSSSERAKVLTEIKKYFPRNEHTITV